jgi:hypothetical protein
LETVGGMSWEQVFHEPIELPDGRVLRTLRDAGEFIQATHGRPEWRAAMRALLLVVEHDGDPLLAYMAFLCLLVAFVPKLLVA